MIFFNIPSVGQLKPETLFGNDDHFGFIQTLIGDTYSRNDVKAKCQLYYNKPTDAYWDRIITLVNFLGLKKTDLQNRITSIPTLNYIAEQYDESNKLPSKVLFDYLLCQWQYPHPILTTNQRNTITELNLEINLQRTDYVVCKPYPIILSILLHLFRKNPDEAYLTNEEFYWFGYEYYRKKGEDFNLDSIAYWIEGIENIRKNGWSYYDNIRNNSGTSTHLSYPKGFLKNSSVLTDGRESYNNVKDFFIGLKQSNHIENKVVSLIKASSSFFDFDRTTSVSDSELSFNFANYLYNPDAINHWMQSVEIYDYDDFRIPNSVITEQNSRIEPETYKVKNLLQRISVLDKETITKRRTEQYLLRNYLLGKKESGKCAICNEDFPIGFLATAHIKKRSNCTDLEKRNINIVMPTCYLGCDKLYEDGYVIVKDGKVKANITNKKTTAIIENYIENIEENDCQYFKDDTKQYFEFHERTNV